MIELESFVDEFKERAAATSVDYQNEDGEWVTDPDPRFGSVSKRFQQRGYIRKGELREIGRWKVQGKRIDRHLKENSPEEVKEQTKPAFSATDDETRITML